MGTVVNIATNQILYSVNTPDYDPAQWLINPPELDTLLKQGIDQKFLKVENGVVVEMAQEEQDAITASELLAFKIQYLQNVGLEIQDYIEKHYVDRSQRMFTFMYAEAIKNSDQPTIAYVQKLWDWVVNIVKTFQGLEVQVLGATTIEEVKAMTLDYANFDSLDPKVTLDQAFVIANK